MNKNIIEIPPELESKTLEYMNAHSQFDKKNNIKLGKNKVKN
ncbi:MAG: hypothetical protein ACOVNU_03095 [Candidatus Kapaibacteriota bacterium]